VLLAPVRTALAFWHGMNRLVGDLVMPPWEGPHPVAVFVDGYGPGGRDQGTWPQRLAAAGIASFAYDKPGCGESTGDWTLQTLQDRAAEVAVAIDLLRDQPGLSSEDLALLGSGQGGWVSLLAAAQGAGIGAVVITSGPALGPLELEQFRLARRMAEAGFGPAEVALAQTLLRERVRRLTAGEGPDSVLASEAAVHRSGWYQLMPGATSEEIAYVARLAAFDPRPALTALRCPLLALYGADDVFLPVDRNVRILTETLQAARHGDHSVIVVPGADHALRVHLGPQEPQLVDGRYASSEVAPGVFELIVTWLDRRLGRVEAPPQPPSPPHQGQPSHQGVPLATF
jgi:pimeloyl-ACP methyl ester carboxylesterase